MSYTAQQAGGLTDRLFEEDPSQSIRERNWFKVDWNIAAAVFTYRLNSKWRFEMRNFGLIGSRDALGVLGYINRPDPEGLRDLMKDDYLNIGNETRMVHTYEFLGNPSNWLVGMRYYRGLQSESKVTVLPVLMLTLILAIRRILNTVITNSQVRM